MATGLLHQAVCGEQPSAVLRLTDDVAYHTDAALPGQLLSGNGLPHQQRVGVDTGCILEPEKRKPTQIWPLTLTQKQQGMCGAPMHSG
jgi:hypothetical protein